MERDVLSKLGEKFKEMTKLIEQLMFDNRYLKEENKFLRAYGRRMEIEKNKLELKKGSADSNDFGVLENSEPMQPREQPTEPTKVIS